MQMDIAPGRIPAVLSHLFFGIPTVTDTQYQNSSAMLNALMYHFNYLSRFLATAFTTSSITIGLAICPFIPASRDA